ncbi:hypothetical protein [Noviherbaspirillum massiliense]|uniref:hypothetical protein n=1 Tax=Noviherbaspirillum massiliense TaxID=1465823 RepID=UPI00036DA00D|nr:hypothetical protein [Noviherbaspirillum massiliense]
MSKNEIMRASLWIGSIFNFVASFILAFPESALGRLVELPPAVPSLYCALSSFLVGLFGGAYAWLACQEQIDRPLVALSTIGKASVFCIALVLWLLGSASVRIVFLASGELILAVLWAWWIFESGQSGTRANMGRHVTR